MANPAFGSRPYNIGRGGGPSTAPQNTFGGGPAAFSSAATTTQHREAQRLEREREDRAQRERVENMQRNQYAGELSEEHREEIHDAFILFDLDHDNHIDYHELKVAMKALGFDLPKAEILAILQAHGVPASSVIPNTNPVAQQQAQKEPVGFTGKNRLLLPLAAFQTEMAGRILSRDPKEEILRAFDLFDEGRKGKINLADLRRVAQELGESLQEEELNAMIDEFDMDGDGEISREEFLGICLG